LISACLPGQYTQFQSQQRQQIFGGIIVVTTQALQDLVVLNFLVGQQGSQALLFLVVGDALSLQGQPSNEVL